MKRYLVYFLSVILVPLTFTSCKRNMDVEVSSGKTEVLFVVEGTEDGIEIKASKANLAPFERGSTLPTSSTKLNSGFELETYALQDTMQAFSSSNTMIHPGSVNTSIQMNRASTTPMETNKKFRILMRKSAGGPWITNALVKVGTALSVIVEIGEQYEYIAYSYNDEQDIPNPLQNGGSLTVQTPKDKDLLWAKNIINITTEGTTREAIHFYHKVALVSLNLDMSLFAGMVTRLQAELTDITYNSANSSKNGHFYTSTLNLETGSLSNPVSYTPSANLFTVIDPNFPAKRNDFFYTSNVEGLASFKIKLNEFEVSGVNQISDPFLLFNYDFTPSAGRPAVSAGHSLTANLLLMKTLPQMYVLSGDSVRYVHFNRAAASWHLLSTTSGLGITGYMNIIPGSDDGSSNRNWDNRYGYSGAAGYMRTNFAVAAGQGTPLATANREKYVPGKIKMEGEIISDMFQTTLGNSRPEELALINKLNAPRKPDLIILSFYNIILSQAENDALIKYVKGGGSIIMLADRGFRRGGSVGYIDAHRSAYRFLRSLFGNGVNDASIQMENHVTTGFGEINATHFLFKMKPTVNNPGVNGFYGNFSNSYWSSNGDIVSVSGMDPSKYISLSENTPIAVGLGSVPSVNGEVMFKHKDYNVFWIGESDFLVNKGYSVSTSTADNSANWRFPLTNTEFGAQYPVDNAKIFGNMVVWSFVQNTINRP